MAESIDTNRDRKGDAICLVFSSPTARVGESVSVPLADFIRLVEPSVKDIYVITNRDEAQDSFYSNRVHFVGNVACPNAGAPILTTVFGELKAQIQTARILISASSSIDVILWRGRSSTFFLPLLLARLKGKKSIVFLESRGSELVSKVYRGPLGIQGFILSRIYKVVEKITHSLSDILVADFPGLLNQPWLSKYERKVFPFPAPIRFVNPEFEISTPFSQRQPVVGYIGRMSREKGVLNLVKAVPSICNEISGVTFIFGGEGPLLEQVNKELEGLISQDQVVVTGWIPHDELPVYLNRIRLLILPSSYEGLGVIVLEAMACGTPVLATPVGGVLDIVTDGKTGFIMEDNSPECITSNVIRALNHPNLAQISQNARVLIGKEYTYDAVEKRWHKLLTSIESAFVQRQTTNHKQC